MTKTISTDAGRVLVAGFSTTEPPAVLLQAASRGELGGFILFGRNFAAIEQVAELNRRLLDAFTPENPPWLSLDQEGGRVARLGPPVVRLPAMRVLGELDNPNLTREAAKVLGRQLRILGFNLDFAPVLDVDTNPANPVIGDRAFGREPQTVVRHALAFAAGLQQGKVAACGKHFPGHGDTDLDSHLGLPRVTHELERLYAVELVPFRAAATDVAAMMTAHVVFDAIEPGMPATLSARAVNGLLREQLGFTGVVFSDDLLMKAIANNFSVDEAAYLAVRAGCDAVLICDQPELTLSAHYALVRRAERDTDFASRLEQAARRSLAIRNKYRPLAPVKDGDMTAELLKENPRIIEDRIAAGRKVSL